MNDGMEFVNESMEKNINSSNKFSSNFNMIIGVATLLIALLGATFAYFSATAMSKENDVHVKSAYVSIYYDGGTEIEATDLIPSTKHVALTHYQKIDEDLPRCTDANGKQVSYVYQFSVMSEGNENEKSKIVASIKVNINEFENLSYYMYVVDLKMDPETNTPVLDVNGFDKVLSYSRLSEVFKNQIDEDIAFIYPQEGVVDPSGGTYSDTNGIYGGVRYNKFSQPSDIINEDDGSVSGTLYPVECLFGVNPDSPNHELDKDTRCNSIEIENNKKYTFQLVIWLNETFAVQDEQGKNFAGTISVDVEGGSIDTGIYEDGQITGREKK